MNEQSLNTQVEAWLAEFNVTMADDQQRRTFIDDPQAGLKTLNLPTEGPHQQAFLQSLQMVAAIHALQNSDQAQGNSKALQKKSNAFEQHFNMKINLLGFVMQVDHAAIKQLPNGKDAIAKLAETAAEVMRVAGEGGPLAPLILIGLLYWSAIFTAYAVVLPEIDQGKGVYLTVSWPQVYLAVASGGLIALAALPVPTAVV